MKMGTIGWIAWVLVIIGALNWGLIGFFNLNLVGAIFGDMTTVARVVYAIVGLAGLGMLVSAFTMKSDKQ